MEGNFKSYVQVKTWLKKRTKKDFFITCTKGNTLEIVICRDNKLKVHSNDVGYWSWFTDQCAQEALDFIEQP